MSPLAKSSLLSSSQFSACRTRPISRLTAPLHQSPVSRSLFLQLALAALQASIWSKTSMNFSSSARVGKLAESRSSFAAPWWPDEAPTKAARPVFAQDGSTPQPAQSGPPQRMEGTDAVFSQYASFQYRMQSTGRLLWRQSSCLSKRHYARIRDMHQAADGSGSK